MNIQRAEREPQQHMTKHAAEKNTSIYFLIPSTSSDPTKNTLKITSRQKQKGMGKMIIKYYVLRNHPNPFLNWGYVLMKQAINIDSLYLYFQKRG